MIANYPGFDEGIDGFTLSMRMRRQAEDLGLNFINEDVLNLHLKKTLSLYGRHQENMRPKPL